MIRLKKVYLLMMPMILSLALVSCSDDDDDNPVLLPTGSIVVDSEEVVEDGMLTINAVSMSNPGWVVIHRDNNGAPMVPEIISVPKMVEENTTSDVVIELKDGEEVEDGETLWVMLHTDDGVIGEYEFNGTNGLDAPITNEAGDIVTESFMVSLANAVTANEQDLVNGVVNVESIKLEQDGYVVIHASNEAGDGPMVPQIISQPVYLEAGEYENVGVPLTDDANVEAGDVLWIMLHNDTGEEQVYEFDGVNDLDLPVMDGENIVMTSVTITDVTTAAMSGTIDVEDQALVDNTITVDNIFVDMDGYVVVHASNADGSGPMVPEIISVPVYVEAGDNPSVEITFTEDANVEVGDTVWVMLHDDTGVEMVYEFDGVNGLDLPLMDDDGIVVTPITITE
ncbi:DUF7282 domain-containing protein [Salinimicrobium sediminilitoris]|uniref:DUF7282 domain-containing protein n=1 Tax=Salinimicrobium sediminilitoris TaxID=2876715 RepID=UPI001E58FF79|nr:hypothetical protein [Salinimicrobium sediminilitoris]MCC8361165.1 hypothetical protein [Salinimicrobium sediminilitoris]